MSEGNNQVCVCLSPLTPSDRKVIKEQLCGFPLSPVLLVAGPPGSDTIYTFELLRFEGCPG